MSKKKSHDRAPDKIGFSVALPKILVWQIEEIAAAEHRSRNGQIEHFLADAVAEWKREHPQHHGHVSKDQAPYDPALKEGERVLAAKRQREKADPPTPPAAAPSQTPPVSA